MPRSVIAKQVSKPIARIIRFVRFWPTNSQVGLAQAVCHAVPSGSGLGPPNCRDHEGANI